MTRWILPLALLTLPSCKDIKLPNLSSMTPSVTFDRVDLGTPNWKGVDADFVLKIKNPNPIGVKLARWTWDLDVAGADFLAGKEDSGAALKASGSSELKIPARLVFSDLLKTAKATKGQGDVPYKIGGTLGFNTPLGVVDVPFTQNGTLQALRKPQIKVQRLRLNKLDILKGRVDLALDLSVSNDGGGTLGLADANWRLKLGDKQVADGVLSEFASVPPGQTSTVSIPLGLNLVELGSTVVKAIKNKSPVPVDFGADLNVTTALGVLPLKVSEQGTVPIK
ncbi:MAG: LEA14-like dessication related protein [Kiritimatiellia bacterium]|jgi:LEA14-like dessication related protein